MTDYDTRYKNIFNHPTMLKELMQSFVDEPFVNDLDFSTAERVDKSFVTKNLRKKESDLIYKIKISGEDVYILKKIDFVPIVFICTQRRRECRVAQRK